MNATGTPGTVLPYEFWIEQQLQAAAQARGFGWIGGPSRLIFQGTAQTYQPIPVTRPVSYTFDVDSHTSVFGGAPVTASGVDVPPAAVTTRLEHFIGTRCGDLLSHQSFIVMNFVPISAQGIAPYLPWSDTGSITITYTYITNDQLQKHVTNGDFEGASLSPWSSTGAGVSRLSSPPQCLAATLNQLLELEAGSPIEVSQSIATPTDPCTLSFDYGFAQDTGTLEIWLGDTRVDQIAAAGLANVFRSRMLTVSDPAVLGQATIALRIVWNAASGQRAWVDNVQVYPVPEPAETLLAAAALLTLCGLRQPVRFGIGAAPQTTRSALSR